MPPPADRFMASPAGAPAASAEPCAADRGAPRPEVPSDEALMLRYARGDAPAFEQLYDRHEAGVYRFLLRSVGIAAVADDLLQEVWISVVRSADRYEPRALFTTWLYRIARTRLIDHWRARDPVILVSLDAPLLDDAGSSLADTAAGAASLEPETALLNKAQARALMLAVEALPPAQREAFLLHTHAGLTLAQIGSITGAALETVKSRLRYASAKLRAAMQAWG